MADAREQYVLRDKRIEVPGVTTLFFSYADGSIPHFVPGQYINVFFPEFNTPEGKAYSISSAPAPAAAAFTITVRDVGQFSHRLCGLSVGDTISASLPYGFFYPEREDSELVLLAAGIGITPFMSMVSAAAMALPNRRITLMHGINAMSDAVFHEAFARLQEQLPHLSVQYFVSREPVTPSDKVIAGRMSADAILSHIGTTTPETEFLICGPISFVRDLWKDLKSHGIPEDRMYTEAFFSH